MSIKKNNFLNGNPPMADDNFLNGVKDEINNLISYFIEEDSSNREQQANAVLTAVLGGLNMKLTPESTSTNYKAVFSSFKKTIFPRNFTFFDGMVLWLNNTIENAGPATITILDRGPYNILNSDGDPLDTGMLKKGLQKLVFSSAFETFYLDEGAGSGSSNYSSVLFKWDFFDRTFRENSPWKRSDTFNWLDGIKYKNAYNHLLNDIKNKAASTETVAGITINCVLADDGHKIILATDTETLANLETLYNKTGIAWYYILDIDNTRFKLPRTQWNFVGLRPNGSVGEYVAESLPNIKGSFASNDFTDNSTNAITSGAFYTVNNNLRDAANGNGGSKTLNFDASRHSSVYKDGVSVQQRANQMILYFYVGEEEVEPEEIVIRNRNIGEIFTTILPVNDNGVIRLFGQEIDVSVDTYKGFYQVLKQLKSQGTCPNLFCTETEWQEFYTQHSFCPKFVIDEVANTIRMPLLKGYCKNVSSLEELGKINEAGLPNIKFSISSQDNGSSFRNADGMAQLEDNVNALSGSNTAGGLKKLTVDASSIQPIYKDGLNTVEVDGYNALVYLVVANSTEEKVSIIEDYEINNTVPLTCPVYVPNLFQDINYLLSDNQWHSGEIYEAVWNLLTTQYNDESSVEIIKTLSDGTSLTLKKTPLDYLICEIGENNTEEKINRFYNEIRFTCWVINTTTNEFKLPQNTQRTLVERYKDENGNWYNLYSDGWVEQGGMISKFTNTEANTGYPNPIALPIKMQDTNYDVRATLRANADNVLNVSGWSYRVLLAIPTSVNSIEIYQYVNGVASGTQTYASWEVKGYANTSALNNQFNFSNHLYFKVGNTTVGAELVYANKVLTELDKKVNRDGSNADFSNLSSTAKTNLFKIIRPNYASSVIKNSGWTATQNGLIFAYNIVLHNAVAQLLVNGVRVGYASGGAAIQDPTSMYAIVGVGDVISFTNISQVLFIPFFN